ncbi:glutamyl-tRNA synthetase [Kribbella voronezhensis]|uniref:Glutamate--tRNA ligase n=1 Tax=Kribbella voronezhensis TaxID=2512212 RepID=A0A4R7STB7_9ACTN|nr:glutamate--tRNA ligase [Kribbella voronezhensis]TDU82431.1 glutamyl-tRNA synthetase [Kribbella voronezhensis]
MTDKPAQTDDDVLGGLAPDQVRLRFAPSPTGLLHVGNIRTALFAWAFARHFGGKLVLRIEDTDTARNTPEGMQFTLDSLRWLNIDWDEGPEVGGAYGPYRQSERMDIYTDVVAKLLAAGKAYHCYCSQEELDQRREAARSAGQHSGYDGHCRALTPEQVQAYIDEGRRPVVRLRMPDRPITFDDLVRGEITFLPENLGDYVLVRANGHPLYPLVNPVDDALMEITHVLRGEDLLSSTPRQIALYEALAEIGIGTGRTPRFGHLPFVMGEGNKKLSKRDPSSSLGEYMERGFLPEGLLNYLALLGWSIGDDRDVFTMDEMIKAFDIRRVNANAARFDPKKCEAINASHMRLLAPAEFAERVVPYLAKAGVLPAEPTAEQRALLDAAVPLVQERMNTLSESVDMLGFLFVDESAFSIDPDAGAKVLTGDAGVVLEATSKALEEVSEWTTEAIEQALRASLIDGLGLKPKNAFGPVRVAISGRRISPPLFESLELLGRDRSLSRIASARAAVATD